MLLITILSLFLTVNVNANEADLRIVGGSEVNPPHSLPYLASLKNVYSGEHVAGASVLDPARVLTAAHVCEVFLPQDLEVVAGEHDLLVEEGVEQVRSLMIRSHYRDISMAPL